MALPRGYDSVVCRVLEIPEILELIFSFVDERSNTANALVCKKWFDQALNLVWRDVSDLSRLFKILSPLTPEDGKGGGPFSFEQQWVSYSILLLTSGHDHSSQVFSHSLQASDWERFSRYARRVRSIYFNCKDKKKNISPRVFDEIGRTRLTFNIFPNLRELAWITDDYDRMRLCSLFMHDSVSHFTISLPRNAITQVSSFFDEVVLRMPTLTHLDLRFASPASSMEAELSSLIRGFPKLHRIILPLFTITNKILEELSRLQSLGTIQFEFMPTQGQGALSDVVNFAPKFQEGAFPALWDLSISAKLPDATKFLSSEFGPTNLTSFYVHVLSTAEPSEVTDFLTAVANHCQRLTHLYVDLLISTTDETAEAIPTKERLTWNDIRPVLLLPKLVAFELRWDRPLSITLENIEELAVKWPSLEVLLLNCEPTDPSEPSALNLSALLPFAQHCPKLEELGLYITASGEDSDLPIPFTPDIKPFKSLKRLCMGLSRISDPGPVALFLSQICPLGCEVTSGVTWPEGFGVLETTLNSERLDEVQSKAESWWNCWHETDRTLPLLTRLRMEEREKRKALEQEVEDLRMRCAVLSDRLGINVSGDGTCIAL